MTSRRWLILRLPAPADETRSALLAEGLLALGGRAVWEEDGRLVTHVPEPADLDAFLANAATVLGESPESDWQPHEDWAFTWRRGIVPRKLTPRLVVTPSWERVEAGPGEIVIVVDPEMAFGNAEHGTTRGCLRLLDAALTPGERVLDVGTGSGILAIAARRLGAREVVALDGDPLACEAARANLGRNGAEEGVQVVEEWAGAASLERFGSFDGVVANLESGILLPLLAGLVGAVRPGGWLILSGILADEVDGVLRATNARGLSPVAVDEDGEWRSIRFAREA